MEKNEIPKYIPFQRKITRPKMVLTIVALSHEWAISYQDAILRLISDGVSRESKRLGIEPTTNY